VIALGMPSSNTLVTELVPREKLHTANSLNVFTFSIARALGPMGGGVLVAAMGLSAPWLALVAFYAIAALCTLGLPKVQMAPIDEASAWSRLAEGIHYVRTHPIISRITLLAFSLLVGSTIMPIWPVYARDRFDVGSSGFGWMMGAFALGQGISALYITGKGKWSRQSVPILYASTIWSVTMVVFGFSTSYPLSLLALFFMGTAVPPWMTSLTTLLQTKSDKAMLGRVMAVYGMSIQVGMFGWFIGAWLGEIIGNDWMLLITGTTFALLHFALILTSKELRQA
jgi:MFS family permease